MQHKFDIGQKVRLIHDFHPAATGDYEVLALLPPDLGGEYQYRIRSDHESHERVMQESRMVRRRDDAA